YRVTLNQNEKIENEDEKNRTLKACHQRCADRTLKVLEKNGSIFIKLGQHLSAMNYLLPLEWTTTFIPLQDKCPVSSYESIEAMFERDTGEQLLDYFSEFAPEPVGSASLAQVHLATVKETGQKVAVKVQHPTLAEWSDLDLSLTAFTFRTLKKFFPEYDLEWLSSEMEYSLPQELDFAREGQNALRTKKYFSHIPEIPLVIPGVLWAKKRILVMENVSGHRPDDLAFLDANGIDRDEVSAALARIFNEMIFGNNAPLHCDPHGGNIAIRKNDQRRGSNFDVILYDHGLYRDIPPNLRRSYAKLWLAVIDANEPRMRKYAKEVAGISDGQFPLFASAITGRDYTVVKSSISAARSAEEKKNINDALGEGMLQQLVQMLGQVPRIILLILKTNDLTRSLDENLHTRLGPVRTFLILARYCSRTVFEEQVEELRKRGSLFAPRNFVGLVGAWLGYFRMEFKLEAFELWLKAKRLVGMV
ncbi:putative ABC1 family protein C15C4.02, partial [Amylocarpus encephaloides]